MLPSNIEENIECKLKKKIGFHKKGNQVWQKGSTRFASGAQVAENELARLFDGEHFSEKTSYIVRPSIACRRALIFNINPTPEIFLVLAHRAMISDNLRTLEQKLGLSHTQICVKTILLLVLDNMIKEGF